METSGSAISALLTKYDYLFDILGAQSECRKPERDVKTKDKPEFKVQSLSLSNFALFPNPTNHSIRLHFNSDPGTLDIFINNTLGKLVYHELIPDFDGNFDKLIDLSHNSNGLLILTVVQNGNVFAEQILFQ